MIKIVKILFIILLISLSMNLNNYLPSLLFLFYGTIFSLILILILKNILFYKVIVINKLNIIVVLFIILLIINALLRNNPYGILNYEARILLWLLYMPLFWV